MDTVEGLWRRAVGQTLCLELRGDACVYGALTGWRGNVQLRRGRDGGGHSAGRCGEVVGHCDAFTHTRAATAAHDAVCGTVLQMPASEQGGVRDC